MATATAIEWTHEPGRKGVTWNPIRARHRVTGKLGWFCIHASAGCKKCYAEAMNAWRGNGVPYTAPALKDVEVFLDEETLAEPLGWRAPRAAFVCSMTDLFGAWVPEEFIDRIFAVMAGSPRHTFIVLTKRADRMQRYLSAPGLARRIWTLAGLDPDTHDDLWPLPHVRLGVSVELQPEADERIPLLLQTPAAVRFLSVEPLLGPVDLQGPDGKPTPRRYLGCECGGNVCSKMRHVDWVIVGGESGPGARPCDLAWIRSVVPQTKAAGVPCFVKQLGARPYFTDDLGDDHMLKPRDRKGGDPAEWPEDLRDVREFPRPVAV